MLTGIIHQLAKAYGWTKNYILDFVYFDEALDYLDRIKIENLQHTLLQVAIVSNPHTKDPKKFVDHIQEQLNKLQRRRIIELTNDALPENNAFGKLRNMLGKKPK